MTTRKTRYAWTMVISWRRFYRTPNSRLCLECQDVCNGTDVPLSFAAMPPSESHQRRWWMLAAATIAAVNFVAVAKPLVLYDGDSIVEKLASNGYARISCGLLKEVADCDVVRVCYSTPDGAPIDCGSAPGGSNYGVTLSIKGLDANVLKLAPSVFHYNMGINTVNCLTPKTVAVKITAGFFADGLRTMIGMFRNSLPHATFVYGASTECDACVQNPICGPDGCGRTNDNIIPLNAAAKDMCEMVGAPYDDLYKASEGQKRTDGRHFDAAGSLKIGTAAADFVRPYIAPTNFRVYPTAPLFDTLITEGSAIRIAATVENGTATKVEFYDGNVLLESDNTAPYEYNWTNPPTGVHSIRIHAVAADKEAWSTPVPFDVKPKGFPLMIDCGGYGNGKFIRDRFYSESSGYGAIETGGVCIKSRLKVPAGTEVTGTNLDPVYTTALIASGCNSSTYFEYRIDVPNGSYYLGLMRAEFKEWFDGENGGQTLHNIWINGKAVETNYDIVAEIGYAAALVKQFAVDVTDEKIIVRVWGKGRQLAFAGLIIDQKEISTESIHGAGASSFVSRPGRAIVNPAFGLIRVTGTDGVALSHVAIYDARGAIIAARQPAGSSVDIETGSRARGIVLVKARWNDGYEAVERVHMQ